MKRVFVTGISGFIGLHLCKVLLQQGIDFFGISNNIANFPYPQKIKKVSILNATELKEILMWYRPDTIIHLAAIASAVYEDIALIYSVNVCGSENLLEAVKSACPEGTTVLLASTAGVYGNQQQSFYDEELPFNPVNHYSCSKMVMELLSRNCYTDLNIKIVRPFNIIGIGQNPSFIVPKLVKAFANRQPEIYLGNIDAVRDYTDVKLCVNAIVAFLNAEDIKHHTLNICTGKGHSVKDVFENLVHITGFRPKVNISSSIIRENDVWRLVGCNKRLIELIGKARPIPDLRTILESMLINESE